MGKKVTFMGRACYIASVVSDPGIKPGSPALQISSLPSEPPGKPVGSTFMGEREAFRPIGIPGGFFPAQKAPRPEPVVF